MFSCSLSPASEEWQFKIFYFHSIVHTISELLALCRELNSFRNTTFPPDACTSGVTTERYVTSCRIVASWWNFVINNKNRRKFVTGITSQTRDIYFFFWVESQDNCWNGSTFFAPTKGSSSKGQLSNLGHQFTLSTQLIKANYLVIPHRRNTTVSLETYPFINFFFRSIHILWWTMLVWQNQEEKKEFSSYWGFWIFI